MPVQKVPGGYRWGSRGKVYKTRAEAERQGRAARAAGYKETARKSEGGRTPPWERDNPKSESKPLTSAQKSRAKAAARRAGRRYPNLVDNMRASRSRS